LGWVRKIEAVEDVALPLVHSAGMHDASHRHLFCEQWAVGKGSRQSLGCETFLGERCVLRNSLTVTALQELVRGEGDLQQIDEGLDALGRFKKQRPDRQRCLPLVVAIFEIALLFELAEQEVAALGQRSGAEERGIAVVDRVALNGLLVKFKLQAMRGQSAAFCSSGVRGTSCQRK
jgi:hypothetical protein